MEQENALKLLDKLDEYRRTHQNDKLHPSDWCMRSMEAIVAKYWTQKRFVLSPLELNAMDLYVKFLR